MGRTELPLLSFPSSDGTTLTRMSKITLIILGLVLLVCLTTLAVGEEEVSSLREVREADLEARKKRKGKGKGRRGRKSGRKARRKSRRKMRKGRTATVPEACFDNSISIMKIWKDPVANYDKQRTRMKRQNETGGKKSGKKGAFGAITQRLVEAGGGNKSAPSCAGSTTNEGAMQLANLTATLDKCEDDIHAACDPSNFPQPNMTFIDMCDALVAEFKTEAGKCLNQSVGGYKQAASTACDCWTATALNELAAKAKNCKAKDEAGAIATALKTCTTAFGKCRKFEDDASTALAACSSDSSKLTMKAAALLANSDAVTAAQTKVKTLTNSSRRLARAASTCAEILTYAQMLAEMAKNSPASPDIITTAAKITGASAVTCTPAEVSALTAVQTDLDDAVAKIGTALAAVQEQLETLTGSTASSSVLASAAPGSGSTSTKAARRQRHFNL